MHTFLVGLLEEVRPVSRTNKKTGELTHSIDATITFESRDLEGYLIKSTENVNFPAELQPKLQPYKGKFIAIPHVFINTPGGSWLFPDSKMAFQAFDKNPLAIATK